MLLAVTEWVQTLGVFVGIGAGLVVLVGAIAAMLSKLVDRLNRQQETRISSAVGTSIDERLTPIRKQIEHVSAASDRNSRQIEAVAREVTFNGGHSLKDAVHRVERQVAGLALVRKSEEAE